MSAGVSVDVLKFQNYAKCHCHQMQEQKFVANQDSFFFVAKHIKFRCITTQLYCTAGYELTI